MECLSAWQHEDKFDGFRVQAHIIGKTVELYSRSGGRFSRRFPRLVSVLGELPTRSAMAYREIREAGGSDQEAHEAAVAALLSELPTLTHKEASAEAVNAIAYATKFWRGAQHLRKWRTTH